MNAGDFEEMLETKHQTEPWMEFAESPLDNTSSSKPSTNSDDSESMERVPDDIAHMTKEELERLRGKLEAWEFEMLKLELQDRENAATKEKEMSKENNHGMSL